MASWQTLALDDCIIESLFPETDTSAGENVGFFPISEGASRGSVGIQSEVPLRPDLPANILLRLEDSSTSLAAVVAMQHAAHSVLPDIVPPCLDLGAVTTCSGRVVEYSIRELFINADGVFTLEEVLPRLSAAAKTAMVDQVVDAMARLQKEAPDVIATIAKLASARDPSAAAAQPDVSATCGGPRMGFATSSRELLGLLFTPSYRSVPACTLTDLPCGGVRVTSVHDEEDAVDFCPADLDALQRSTVLCHGNLEPRNILVQRVGGSDASPQFTLAGIIGWERAAFVPFAVEYGKKDAGLGKENSDFAWYSLFKQRSARLLPEEPVTDKLLAALWLYDVACDADLPFNVRLHLQERWMQFHGIEQSPEIRVGWARKPEAGALPVMTHEEWHIMQESVLEELGLLDREVLDELEKIIFETDLAKM